MMDPTTIAIVVGLYLLGRGGKADAGPRRATGPASGAAFERRANQKRALDWAPLFVSQDASPALAAGLARWAGIESSGNPLAVSPAKGSKKRPGGERGLLQVTGTTSEGIYTDPEWAAMQSPSTRNEEHARLALKLYRAMLVRARRRISNPPPAADVASALWYAKIQHARPVDVTEARLHGPALQMARDLAIRWAGDDAKMRRLYAANVIAFGKAVP
jgi:hypothetical protein